MLTFCWLFVFHHFHCGNSNFCELLLNVRKEGGKTYLETTKVLLLF